MKYKAVISDYVWPSLDIEQKLLGSHNVDIVDCNNSTKEELIAVSYTHLTLPTIYSV